MIINKNENINPFDVDGTLVIHQEPSTIPPEEALQVYDAVTKKFITVRINRPMVRLLIEAKARGFYIRVWSRGGWRWATDVIKALDLVKYVDMVESKPLIYFDDVSITEWLKDRVFIGPEIPYKTISKMNKLTPKQRS